MVQNPKERITLSKMMKHPWVTRGGGWPLRSVKEMIRVGERPELPPVLPDLMSTLNVLDIPRQVPEHPMPWRCFVRRCAFCQLYTVLETWSSTGGFVLVRIFRQGKSEGFVA